MGNSKKYYFASDLNNLKFRTAVISGVSRSGKTLLGKLLGTASFAEHMDESWIATNLPLMAKLKMMDEKVARNVFTAYTTELFNDVILLRHANFRPKDLSTIWEQKTSKEISSRLIGLESRSDVRKFSAEHNPLLIYTLPGVMSCISFFAKALPKTKFIHVVRRGHDVAQDVVDKQWFSDSRLQHTRGALCYHSFNYKNKKWHLPWWVDFGDEKQFVEFSEFERALYYWSSLLRKNISAINKFSEKKRCMVVRYEDLTQSPSRVLNEALKHLKINKSLRTKEELSKVYSCKSQGKLPSFGVEPGLYRRVRKLYNIFGYE